MKRILAIILTLALALCLCACGGTGKNTNGPSPSQVDDLGAQESDSPASPSLAEPVENGAFAPEGIWRVSPGFLLTFNPENQTVSGLANMVDRPFSYDEAAGTLEISTMGLSDTTSVTFVISKTSGGLRVNNIEQSLEEQPLEYYLLVGPEDDFTPDGTWLMYGYADSEMYMMFDTSSGQVAHYISEDGGLLTAKGGLLPFEYSEISQTLVLGDVETADCAEYNIRMYLGMPLLQFNTVEGTYIVLINEPDQDSLISRIAD